MSMFETCISQLVKAELTNETVKTEWFNGTLFISPITGSQGEQVAEMLRNREVGKIIATQIGDTSEFAYDFV